MLVVWKAIGLYPKECGSPLNEDLVGSVGVLVGAEVERDQVHCDLLKRYLLMDHSDGFDS